MTAGTYLLATLKLLLFVGALGFTAYQIRVWLLPTWWGATARLAEVVLGASLAIWLGEGLGTVGLFKEFPLLLGSLVMAFGAWRLAAARRHPDSGQWIELPAVGWPTLAAGGVVAALVFAKWALGTLPILDQGMWAFDTMYYHMPVAAGFAQSGSVTWLHFTDPGTVTWCLPVNSELIHGEGIAIAGSDIFSPFMNLGWMSLALLAGWCIGRPYGRAWISLLATATVLVTPVLLARQPGEAASDTPAIAFLLCSAAILVVALDSGDAGRRFDRTSVRPLLLAALAAGLALGAKGNLVVLVASLGLCASVTAVRGFRIRVAIIWAIAALSTGGYWYVRNLIAFGNPIPWVGTLQLGPLSLPTPHQLFVLTPGWNSNSIADYLTDGSVLRNYLEPGLKYAVGEAWPLFVGLIGLGAIGALVFRNTPAQRALGATALLGTAAFVLAPGVAAGPPGHPQFLGGHVRYGLPALALALVLLPTLRPMRQPAVAPALASLLGILLVLNLTQNGPLSNPYLGGAAVMTAGALMAVAIAAWLSGGVLRPFDGTLYGAALVGVATLLFLPQVRQYMAHRYTTVWAATGLDSSFLWAKDVSNARIGLAGTLGAYYQYAYYGDDSSNRVIYVGVRGPHGSFNAIQGCGAWRAAVNAGHFDYVITTPYERSSTSSSPEETWTAPGRATTRILRDGDVSIFRVEGRLTPTGCDAPDVSRSRVPPP